MADGTGTQGTDRIFDRETMLDLTVNIIPLGIILFFLVFFTLYRPFGVDVVATTIMVGLHVIPFVSLAILTYFAGKVITEAERHGESETAENVAQTAIGVGEGTAEDEGGDSEIQEDHPSTGASGTAAPAGADTDRAQQTGSRSEGNDEEGAERTSDDEAESSGE